MKTFLQILVLLICCSCIQIKSIYPTKGITGNSTIIVTLIDLQYCAIKCLVNSIYNQCTTQGNNITLSCYFPSSSDYSISISCNDTYSSQFQYNVMQYTPIITPKLELRNKINSYIQRANNKPSCTN